ncbi:MAG TPA: immunity 17 family protein [Candidatus Eremiobacteraeota bacterium]|nr:MAG: hypothetical protein BWY64_02252 [bacterium ADurb.Bin363]HPZ09575.1 immunity 17 family protein [Candidatus Eremiobacteraeota bacterium]
MTENLFIGIICIFGDLFSLISSIFNWDFFFNSRKARFMVNMFGRKGERIFYSIFGLVVSGVGIVALLLPFIFPEK